MFPGLLHLGLCWWLNRSPVHETQETQVQSLGREDPLEKGIATHSSILAWKIPWTEESSGLLSRQYKGLGMTECIHAHTQTHNLILHLTSYSWPYHISRVKIPHLTITSDLWFLKKLLTYKTCII